MGHRAVEPFRDGAKVLDPADHVGLSGHPVEALQRGPGSLWDAIAVLPGEHTRRKRAPDRVAVTGLFGQASELGIDATLKQVVLTLLSDGLVQTVLLGDTHRLPYLFGGPFRRAPVVGLAR